MTYVITCGDEGVQINDGVRLAFAGSGFRLDGFSQVVPYLKQLFDSELAVVSSEENDWFKKKLDLINWEQINAMSQQHTQALAEREGLLYVGYLPFADPKQLEHGVRGHMVRPHGVHIANKICFTLGGGEQTYNLGCYLISAEWVHLASESLVKEVIGAQVAFYEALAGQSLIKTYEMDGELGEEVATKNKAMLESALGL